MDMSNIASIGQIPTEVRKKIFQYLSDDRGSLAACALTCRAWYLISRSHFFHSVHLLGSPRYAQFEELLLAAPYLAAYVRDLSITMDGTFTWLDQEAPRILLRLNRVEHLKFRNWSATIMSDETRRNLQMYFPRVRTLVLQDTAFAGNDFPLVLCACPRLSSLQLYDVYWSHRNRTLVSAVVNSRQHIQALGLRHISPLASAWLTNGVFEMRLQKLELCWGDPAQLPHVRHLLKEAGSTLEYVVIAPSFDVANSAADLDGCLADIGLSANTALRTLRLVIETARSEAHAWPPKVLEQLRSEDIRRIELVLLLPYEGRLSSVDWDQIDLHLSRQAAAHPKLTVSIDVHMAWTEPSEKAVAHEVAARLPRLTVETKRLEFDCTYTACDIRSAWPCLHPAIVKAP